METEEDKLYYKIGEVAEMFSVNTSLIRHWETVFPNLKPRKNRRGARVFTKSDIAELKKIYHLVKEQGHTLEAAKRKLRHSQNPEEKHMLIQDKLTSIKQFLQEIRNEI